MRDFYDPKDFTLEAYKRLLRIASKRGVTKYSSEPQKNDLVWRHDVDISPERALVLAKMEADQGIEAFYFFMAASEFYNLQEPRVRKIVREIEYMGHTIGLHFDSDRVKEDQVLEDLNLQVKLLRLVTTNGIEFISFHNTTLSQVSFLEDEYVAGLFNVFSRKTKMNYKYCADSNGYWRELSLKQALSQETPLQALTHPVWWTAREASPYEKVKSSVNERASLLMNEYSSILELSKRENLGY